MKKVLVLMLIGMSFSCSDQAPMKRLHNENEIQVSEAMQHYASEAIDQKPVRENTRLKSNRHYLLKKAVWESAFFQELSFGKGLIVPVRFDTDIFYKATNTDIKVPISSLTYLLFYKDAWKKNQMEVITSLPSFDKNDTIQGQSFKGTVLVEKWNGDFISGFIFKNGEIYKTSAVQQRKTTDGRVDICTTTDWYTCTSNGSENNYSCHYDYTETICSGGSGTGSGTGGSNGGGDSGGSGSTGGGGSSSGSPTPSDYGDSVSPKGYKGLNPDQTIGKLCDKLTFSQIGRSFTAEISGLGLTAVNAQLNRVINAELGTCCVQIPDYQLSDRFAASTAFTIAYNSARSVIPGLLNSGSLSPDAVSIRGKLKSLILNILNESYPGSSFSTQPCSGNVAKNTADYGC
jgi:uncharacterized membrane protein YgcG